MKKIITYYRKKKAYWRERQFHDVDSSSVGDLAFLLLIFFIVTGSFILRQGIFLSLPSENSSSVKVEENLIFEVAPHEDVFEHDGKMFTRAELAGEIIRRKEKTPELILIVLMKENISYNRFIDTLSVAKEAGIKKISIKNEVSS
ncbi:MAG: biopolymer transporter ExbD [Spirochaetia bacterium]|nr:biopolymer transporter ExbD [Spirochaetia bacterium]